MLSKYGLASSVAAGAYNIAAEPLYFVRSGYFNLTNSAGTFRRAGAYGQGWSSRAAAYTSSTSATAYYLEYRPTEVNPSNGPNNRWNGFSLRCLDFAAAGADLLPDFCQNYIKSVNTIDKISNLCYNGGIG